jgi:hypothetical protein
VLLRYAASLAKSIGDKSIHVVVGAADKRLMSLATINLLRGAIDRYRCAKRASVLAMAVMASFLSLSCGGGDLIPAGPTPTAPPAVAPGLPLAPSGLTASSALSVKGNEVTVVWNASIGAASYVVEAGSGPRTADVMVADAQSTSFIWHDAPPGRYYLRVLAKNQAGTSAPSTELTIVVIDLRDYIEAIFLGSGPLVPTDGNIGCPVANRWSTFRFGSVVRVRVSTTVSVDKLDAIQRAAEQVADATNGAISVSVELTADPTPIPAANEVTSTTHATPSALGCPTDSGCSMPRLSSGFLSTGRAVQPPNQTPAAYAHDVIGHDVMGMCHIDGNLIGGAQLSLMSAGPGVSSGQIAIRLSNYDMAAAKPVYGSGLASGATRADFARLGLVR